MPATVPPAPTSALHGLAGAAVPTQADWTIDQQWTAYTPAEHATWRVLFERQTRLLPGHACDAFIDGMQKLPLAADQIPDFHHLSDVLSARTGWQVVAVPGLIPDDVFFDHLAHRRFPAGNFIRLPHQLDYLEEPDVFHDIFGHVPMLMNPVMADFIQAYGEAGARAQQRGCLPQLARVYWYTVEFGLVEQANGLRLYGAGIASSHTESRFCLESPSPHHVRFDLARVMRTRYRIDDFQEIYFVLRDLDELLNLAAIDFSPFYDRATQAPELDPGELLPDDAVRQRGDNSYHRNRVGKAAV